MSADKLRAALEYFQEAGYPDATELAAVDIESGRVFVMATDEPLLIRDLRAAVDGEPIDFCPEGRYLGSLAVARTDSGSGHRLLGRRPLGKQDVARLRSRLCADEG